MKTTSPESLITMTTLDARRQGGRMATREHKRRAQNGRMTTREHKRIS